MTRAPPTCSGCGDVGHRKTKCPKRVQPAPYPRHVRLPLYLAPLPRRGRVPGKHEPRVFEHVSRVETHESITHVWRAADGRTITASGVKRPVGCLSAEWVWEGLIVSRRFVDAEHVRHALPTFIVTEALNPGARAT